MPTPNIDSATPPRICHITAVPSALALRGSRFAQPPPPTLTAASLMSANASLTIDNIANCTVIPGSGGQNQCNDLTVRSFVPRDIGLLVGDDDTPVTLTAKNDICEFANSNVLKVVPVPIITELQPPAVCFDQVGSKKKKKNQKKNIFQKKTCTYRLHWLQLLVLNSRLVWPVYVCYTRTVSPH